jgi:formylglycine-generating enzyme
MYLDKSMITRYQDEVSQIDPSEFTISTTEHFKKGPVEKDKRKRIRVCFGGNTESRQLYFGQIFQTELSYVMDANGIYASNSLIGFMESDAVVLCFEDEAEYLSWLTNGVELDFLLYNTPNTKRFFVTGRLATLLNLRELSDILDTEVEYLRRDSLEAVRLDIGGRIPANPFVDSIVLVPTGSAVYQDEAVVVPQDARGLHFTGYLTDTDGCDMQGSVLYMCDRFIEGAINVGYGADFFETVSVDKPFLVSQSEITQALYESVMRFNPSSFKGRVSFERQEKSENPVDSISWFDTIRFCNRLSQMQGFKPCYTIEYSRNRHGVYTEDIENIDWDRSANGYRLLTEKEWEYIARANRAFKYSGSDDINKVAWYANNSNGRTHPVGAKQENSFGTYDQSGNLFEWCWDLYSKNVDGRTNRGGHWLQMPGYMSNAYRGVSSIKRKTNKCGSRIARSPDPSEYV